MRPGSSARGGLPISARRVTSMPSSAPPGRQQDSSVKRHWPASSRSFARAWKHSSSNCPRTLEAAACPPTRHGRACVGAWRSHNPMAASRHAADTKPTTPHAEPASGSCSWRLPQPRRPSPTSGAPGSPRRNVPTSQPERSKTSRPTAASGSSPTSPTCPSAITERHVRHWMIAMTEQHDAGAISAKTINNARAALSSVLGDAARQDLLPRNPCRFVRPLPTEHRELPYLRLNEIDRYLRACPAHHRPLAELLIGTGARISEALALTWPDIDFGPRHRADPAPTRTTRRQHHPDQRQACPHRPDPPAPHRNAAHPPQHHAPGEHGWRFESSSAHHGSPAFAGLSSF
jgi:hypothetical protein